MVFFYSFAFLPSGIMGTELSQIPLTSPPYNGKIEGQIDTKSIINCHKYNYDFLQKLGGVIKNDRLIDNMKLLVKEVIPRKRNLF